MIYQLSTIVSNLLDILKKKDINIDGRDLYIQISKI